MLNLRLCLFSFVQPPVPKNKAFQFTTMYVFYFYNMFNYCVATMYGCLNLLRVGRAQYILPVMRDGVTNLTAGLHFCKLCFLVSVLSLFTLPLVLLLFMVSHLFSDWQLL